MILNGKFLRQPWLSAMVKGSNMIGTSYESQPVPVLAQRTRFLSVIILFNCSSILLACSWIYPLSSISGTRHTWIISQNILLNNTQHQSLRLLASLFRKWLIYTPNHREVSCNLHNRCHTVLSSVHSCLNIIY